MTGSDSYQKFTVLDEEIEVYLRITKVDEETGKPVLLPDTAFQIYWLDEQGHYRYDSNGNPKLVTMTDTVNGHLTKDVDTFHTNSEGILTLPEKLPLGKYRIVEVTGPNGFYNEWLDSAGYENGILADDADGIYYVDFEITTDRIYAATGDKNENGMDTLVIGENYSNHETLGKLTIRKTGEVLAGWKTEVGALDPWMTGEAEDGNFVYETRPLASAEYTITAAEDIYTQDRQTDNYGNHLEECEVYYLTTKNILFWKWDDWKLLDDATVIMQDDITKVQISKKDLTTNEELPGAELIITDEKGSEIDRWISTDAPHYMEKLPAGKYTLTEVTAPDGYAIAERMEFEVLPNGEVQTFEMFDDTIKVKISKVDITTNEELPGAELVIKDKDGTEIDRWISTNGPHYVEKMPAGDYTLTEITAPNGYKVAESIDFTVLPTGEMQTVVMKDAREDTPTPTPDNTPTPDHTPQPTPNTTPAPTPVPAAPTATPTPLLTIPKTGDNSSLGLLLAIAGISLAGLAVLVHKSARRKDIAPRDDDDEDTED